MVETTGIPEVGDIIRKMTVVATGTKGDGIVKTAVGFIIFVKGAKKGDCLDIKIQKVFDKYAFADIVAKDTEEPEEEDQDETDDEGEETAEDEDDEEETEESGTE